MLPPATEEHKEMCNTPRRAHPAAQVRRQLIFASAWSIDTPLPANKLSSVPSTATTANC